MSALPPGPSEPPVVQTLRWLLRPISFLESCRRRFGDAFSVTFLGFQSPMVMLSDPEAIRALYTVPGPHAAARPHARAAADHGLALAAAARGPRAPRAAQADAAAVPWRAHARVRGDGARGRRARGRRRWPSGEPFALHPRMQAVTLEVILRAVFGVTDSARPRAAGASGSGSCWPDTSSPGLQFGVLLSRRFGGPDPLARLAGAAAGDRRAARAPRSPRGAPTRARTSCRC